MAASKSKSAKARHKPKKTASKGAKSAARSKAKKKLSQTRKIAPQKSRRKAAAPLADVEIKKPKKRRAKKTDALTELLSRLRHEVEPTDAPAWLVDSVAAKLIPLNRAGASLFDLDAHVDTTVALDRGMPALETLKTLSEQFAANNAPVTSAATSLLFWTPSGAITQTCTITAHTLEHRVFLLVQSAQHADAKKVTQDSASRAPEISPSPRPLKGDDAAILREIARRIRAGTGVQSKIDDVPGELPTPSPTEHDTVPESPEEIGHDNVSEGLAPGLNLDRHQRAKLAHELRTPISAIMAASEIIKDERLGSLDNFHYRDYARDIYQSARHALELIEQGLKSAARVESPTTPVPTNPVSKTDRADLNEIVRTALAAIKHLARKKNVSLAFVASERDACLNVDPLAVTQIVLNLLNNAVKFTESGGSISAQVYSSLGEDIWIEVRDTGCGMRTSEIARFLNDDEEQAPEPRAGGGFGIGLALSRKLAKANDASLEYESTLGAGTTARLVFPLRRLVAA